MTAAREPYFTPEAYFAWEERQPDKHELIDGCVYAMGGGTQNHSTLAINLLLLLRNHLRGGPCRVFNSDLKVNLLHTSNYTYPDLSVTCDERDREHPLYIRYPCVIVEVLADSTEAYDRGKKFAKYRRNPNLMDYVLVSSEEMVVDVYRKNEAGDWLIVSYGAGDRLELVSTGFRATLEEIYEGVVLDS
ncbi:MAG TPA: hypothetical protein DCQ32_01120 [Cyanobacteria bacterium UBA8156]|jgi:Uma2 family endonuclease|nr:hypothetical protein [Cyanobacteria bacterium UBA8156]